MNFEEMQILYKSHWLSRPWYQPWVPQSINTQDWRHLQSRIPDISDGSPIIHRPVQRIPRLRAELWLNCRSLEREQRKGQLRTFYRITDDEIATLVTLKSRIAESTCSESFTFARRLYSRNRSLRQAEWMSHFAEAAWRNQQNNRILVLFVEWCRVCIRHNVRWMPCSSLGSVTA